MTSPTLQKPQQPQMPQLPQLHGVLVLNKPKGPTSTRCITQIKRLGQKKIGHAGTLDPMATGVLLVLLGRKGGSAVAAACVNAMADMVLAEKAI